MKKLIILLYILSASGSTYSHGVLETDVLSEKMEAFVLKCISKGSSVNANLINSCSGAASMIYTGTKPPLTRLKECFDEDDHDVRQQCLKMLGH